MTRPARMWLASAASGTPVRARRESEGIDATTQSGYYSQMKTASISEAKNRLSAYIDLVRRGETVQITDRGNPVARLVPLEAGSKEFDESWLAEMERLGIIRRPKRQPLKKLQAPVKLKHRIDAVRLVAADREGR